MKNKLSYEELEEKIAALEARLAVSETQHQGETKNSLLLQTLLDTIPSPIFYKDRDGVYQNCNDAFCDIILGVPKHKIINHSLFDLPDLIPHELAKIYYEKDQVLFDKPGTQIYQCGVKCADGVHREYSFYKATVIDQQNDVVGLVGVMLDITELENKKSELRKNIKLLETLSFTDPLTELYNRRRFNEVFSEQLRASKRHRYILNFAMLDVDDFKLYNDTYGHPQGDRVLKNIANTLKQRLLRPDDYVFRLGGEEFGVLYQSNDEKSALAFADSLREEVEQLNIQHASGSGLKNITISLGLIIIEHEMSDIAHIYELADALLYKAKKSGKNKVVSSISEATDRDSVIS